jgi:hypothetical protein
MRSEKEKPAQRSRLFRKRAKMQLKVLLLPLENQSAAEAEMNSFLRAHRVFSRVALSRIGCEEAIS